MCLLRNGKHGDFHVEAALATWRLRKGCIIVLRSLLGPLYGNELFPLAYEGSNTHIDCFDNNIMANVKSCHPIMCCRSASLVPNRRFHLMKRDILHIAVSRFTGHSICALADNKHGASHLLAGGVLSILASLPGVPGDAQACKAGDSGGRSAGPEDFILGKMLSRATTRLKLRMTRASGRKFDVFWALASKGLNNNINQRISACPPVLVVTRVIGACLATADCTLAMS